MAPNFSQTVSPQPQAPFSSAGAASAGMSPQDLFAINAQMAYQKALLNKKLEEQQRENLVNRLQQQQQQQHSEGHSAELTDNQHSVAMATAASAMGGSGGNVKPRYPGFLPTSVLKQMHGKTPTNYAATAKEAADLHKAVHQQQHDRGGRMPGSEISSLAAARPIVQQQGAVSGGLPPNVSSSTAGGSSSTLSSAASPQDVMRFVQQQQQQAAHQMQLIRLQQLQMIQKAGLMPRMSPSANKSLTNEDYQQMVAFAVLQQRQQEQIRVAAAAAVSVASSMPGGVDLLRQRAMLAAAAQQQHSQMSPQQQLLNSVRPQNFGAANVTTRQQQQEINLRNLFNVGNYASSSSVVFPPMSGSGNTKPVTLDEVERLEKARTSPTTASSSSANQ